jgi:type I restriction enzyme S subunit
MRQMKDSGIEWIGEIPQDWCLSKLKYHINFVKGKNPKELNTQNNGKPYIGATEMLDGESRYYTTDENLPTCSKDDILILWDGANAGIVSLGHEGVVSSTVSIIKERKSFFYKKYLYYFLKSKEISFKDKVNGTTIPHMSRDYVEKTYITFHKEMLVQKQISEYLDKKCSEIDACLSDVNESILKLQEYKKSIITEAVTKGLDPNAEMKDSGIEWIGEIPKNWTVSKLKYLGQAIIGLTYSPDNIDDEGFLVLRSSNIQEGKLSLNDTVIVNKEIPKKLIIKKDDLLICSRNGSKSLIGKTIMIKDNLESTTFGAFMTVFRSDYNSFIYYVLQSEIFNYHIETFLTSTINQLTTGNLNGIKITLPRETAEQQQIADYLDNKCAEIDNVIEDKKELANKLKEYKNSLIYECVTGKREVG